jgi:hypothetical protein
MYGVALALILDRRVKQVASWMGQKRDVKYLEEEKCEDHWHGTEGLSKKRRILIGFFKKYIGIREKEDEKMRLAEREVIGNKVIDSLK